MKAQMFSAFNVLRYHNNHHRSKISCDILNFTLNKLYFKRTNDLISIFKGEYQRLQINREIEESANQHSQILVLGMYFGAWAKKTKTSKTVNTFKLFKVSLFK